MSAPSIEPLVAREEWRPAILETLKQGGVTDTAMRRTWSAGLRKWVGRLV